MKVNRQFKHSMWQFLMTILRLCTKKVRNPDENCLKDKNHLKLVEALVRKDKQASKRFPKYLFNVLLPHSGIRMSMLIVT